MIKSTFMTENTGGIEIGRSEISDETYPPCMDSCNYNLLQLGSIEKGEGLVGPVCRVRSAHEWIYSSRSRREDASIVHSNAKPTPILLELYPVILFIPCLCIHFVHA